MGKERLPLMARLKLFVGFLLRREALSLPAYQAGSSLDHILLLQLNKLSWASSLVTWSAALGTGHDQVLSAPASLLPTTHF